MAATTRLRTNNVFGTTTNNPLLVGGTTLNSAGLANLAVVAGADRAVITLDPNRVNGAPEIVIVTAHSGAATSATITRGAEGTAAREHPSGTFWVHAATAVDFGTDWKAWTPTFTNFTLGNGSVIAKYVQVGSTVWYRLLVTLGSTSTVGTNPRFTLPVTAVAHNATEPIGDGGANDATGSNWFLRVWGFSTTEGRLVFLNGASNLDAITATVPFTWTTSDEIAARGCYEAA